MDPFVKKAGWSRNLLVGISALIVGGLAIGWVAMRYINYIRSGGIPSGDTPFAQVAISYPQNGDQLEIGEFAIVDANAIGLNAFTSIELWLDGTLAGVQMAHEGTPTDTKMVSHAVIAKQWGSKWVPMWFLEAKWLKNRLKVA